MLLIPKSNGIPTKILQLNFFYTFIFLIYITIKGIKIIIVKICSLKQAFYLFYQARET